WSTQASLPNIEKCFSVVGRDSKTAVYVDFLNLLDSPGIRRGDSYAMTTEAVLALKRFAIELNIPVIAAAQLSRAIEQRDDKTPQLSDFRDSGRLEESADTILGLYRDGYYNKDTTRPDEIEVHCLKNKNGVPGSRYFLAWDG